MIQGKTNHSVKHIGIVGCSAEGAALCYKTICTESPAIMGAHAHPEVSMHTISLAEYVACLDANDINGVGDLMLRSAHKLKRQGADFLICPDNTIHQAFDYVNKHSPLPWIHIADAVLRQAQQQNFQRLGILGTKWLVESAVYPKKIEESRLNWERPSSQEIAEMGRLIMDELVCGVFKPETMAHFQGIIEGLKNSGCDAVILGCTEIPLIINDSNSPLPTLDSTRLLARAAIQKAVEEPQRTRESC